MFLCGIQFESAMNSTLITFINCTFSKLSWQCSFWLNITLGSMCRGMRPAFTHSEWNESVCMCVFVCSLYWCDRRRINEVWNWFNAKCSRKKNEHQPENRRKLKIRCLKTGGNGTLANETLFPLARRMKRQLQINNKFHYYKINAQKGNPFVDLPPSKTRLDESAISRKRISFHIVTRHVFNSLSLVHTMCFMECKPASTLLLLLLL